MRRHPIRVLVDGYAAWGADRWYVVGLVLPALIGVIVLGMFAALGWWWLWPIVVGVGVPATLVIWPTSRERHSADEFGWHLG
jgi:hypothetical protein